MGRGRKKTSEIKKERLKQQVKKCCIIRGLGGGLTKNPVVKNTLYPTESSLWTMSS